MHTKTRNVIIAAALALGLAIGGSTVASAASLADVTASPSSVTVGASSKITASGLGELTTATFGLDGTPGGLLSDGSGTPSTSVHVTVTDGEATAEFTASQSGTFTIAVGDGETVLGTTTITVTSGAAPITAASVIASPRSISAGESTVITASELGVLSSVSFGVDGTPGGSLRASSGSTVGSTSVDVAVTSGQATAEFTSTDPGTFIISVGNGESVLATTTVTVAAAADPAPSPSHTAVAPTHEDGVPAFVFWIIGVVGLLAIAGVVLAIVAVRRRSTES